MPVVTPLIASVVVGTAVVVVAPYTLPALGFGAAGVTSGSLAAGIQAGIGNVAAGSLFAALQSAGAGGAWAATAATAGKVAGVITGVGAGAVAAFFA